MAKNSKHCALVTGASAGIGEAFCDALAARGHDLVLVARRKDRLGTLAERLAHQHGTRALVVDQDLADPEAPERIRRAVDEAGFVVDVLVNNAGYGMPGRFLESSWQEHADFIQVLLTSTVHLTRLFLPDMVEGGYGRVVNVASLAGLLPGTPGQSLYAGAKAFVVKTSESLAAEMDGTGVQVMAVCPGLTYSEFHDVVGTREQVSQLPSYAWMHAPTVVRQSLAALERGVVIFVPGPVNKVLAGLAKLLPSRMGQRAAAKQGSRIRMQHKPVP